MANESDVCWNTVGQRLSSKSGCCCVEWCYSCKHVGMFSYAVECCLAKVLPWSWSRPKMEFLRPKRMLKVLPAEVVLLGQETCIKLMWQLVGMKSMQPRGWGRPPACRTEGHTLFLSSWANCGTLDRIIKVNLFRLWFVFPIRKIFDFRTEANLKTEVAEGRCTSLSNH